MKWLLRCVSSADGRKALGLCGGEPSVCVPKVRTVTLLAVRQLCLCLEEGWAWLSLPLGAAVGMGAAFPRGSGSL